MRNIYKALIPMVLAIGIVGGIFIGKYVADIQLSPEEQKLRTILGLIREQYVDEIDIDSLMEKSIPDILASLDNRGFLNRNQEWLTRGADGHIHSLMQLATAYNALEGLGAADIRDAIRKRIHTTLSLPTVVSKQRRLNVSEDLYHEFKTSAVFPADNHMQPDEQIQGFVIARTVASLLNTDGGTIYLGVDNGGNVVGLDNDFRYLNKTPSGKYDIRETQDRYNLYLQKVLRL